jgi:HEAT repeat protein
LAHIADPAAVQALVDVWGRSSGAAHLAAAEACLKAADHQAAGGDKAAAVAVYRKLYAAGEAPMIRAGALRGVIATEPRPNSVLMEALRGDDVRLQAIAIAGLSNGDSVKQLMAEMPKLSEAARIRVLGTLSDQRQSGVLPAFTASLRDSSKAVQIAALDGIGVVGDASVVGSLATIAAGDDEGTRAAARNALARLPGKDVDQQLIEGLNGGEPKIRLELIRAIGGRGMSSAGPALLKLARDPNEEVRRESLRALRNTGTAGDLNGLLAVLVSPAAPGDRAEASRSLSTVIRRADASGIQQVVSAYKGSSDAEVRAGLLQAVGQTGDAQALPILRAALKDDQPEVKRAAILALTDWPDASPLPDLFETSRMASNPAHQVLALRGAIKLIGLPSPGRPAGETVKLLADALSLAKGVEEKRAVLALLPRYPTAESLEMARAALKDTSVSAEAQAAVTRLERTVRR